MLDSGKRSAQWLLEGEPHLEAAHPVYDEYYLSQTGQEVTYLGNDCPLWQSHEVNGCTIERPNTVIIRNANDSCLEAPKEFVEIDCHRKVQDTFIWEKPNNLCTVPDQWD